LGEGAREPAEPVESELDLWLRATLGTDANAGCFGPAYEGR